MNGRAGSSKPLILTLSARLDAAVQAGWEAWHGAAREAGPETVAAWLAQGVSDPDLRAAVLPSVRSLLDPADVEEQAGALIELAELADGIDHLLADTLWEGVLSIGRDTDDPDIVFEATTRLAAIAETQGDPLAAAEYYIDFLNWRRQDHHASDPDDVETAFDQIIRLATQDGAQKEAARSLPTAKPALRAYGRRTTTGRWPGTGNMIRPPTRAGDRALDPISRPQSGPGWNESECHPWVATAGFGERARDAQLPAGTENPGAILAARRPLQRPPEEDREERP